MSQFFVVIEIEKYAFSGPGYPLIWNHGSGVRQDTDGQRINSS